MARSIRSLIWTLLFAILPLSAAENMLVSSSLNPCQANNAFSATLFDVVFTPSNGSLAWDIVGVSSITGKVTIDFRVYAYGLKIFSNEIDLCATTDLQGMCPMREGQINILANAPIPQDQLAGIPGEFDAHLIAQ